MRNVGDGELGESRKRALGNDESGNDSEDGRPTNVGKRRRVG